MSVPHRTNIFQELLKLLSQQLRINRPKGTGPSAASSATVASRVLQRAAAELPLVERSKRVGHRHLLFRDPVVLAELYPALLRRGLDSFQSQSPDVPRFLGHKLPAQGGVNGNFPGLVQRDLKRRH